MIEQAPQSRASCNFCSKDKADVTKLIVANNVGICDECIELCSSILSKEKNEELLARLKTYTNRPSKNKNYYERHKGGILEKKKQKYHNASLLP